MYKKDKIRTGLLWGFGALAVGICLAVIGLLVYSMVIRTAYRSLCMEINDAILAVSVEECSVGRNGETFPASAELLNYYDRFLLSEGTTAFNRRVIPADERTIVLAIGDNTLFLSGTDNNTAVNVCWVTADKTQSYTVRTESTTFSQLASYYVNYKNRLASP